MICRTWSTARARSRIGGPSGHRRAAQSLPPTVELAAYRVVQESLTNALRYARSASASVALRYLDDGLDLVVENDDAGSTSRGSGP